MNKRNGAPPILAALCAFVTLGCYAAEGPAPTTTTLKPQHYDIRPDRLPAPYETNSATNPPDIRPRPANASLQLPPGFKISIWARDLRNPRNMIQVANGDVLVAETDAGRVSVLRDANNDGVPETKFALLSDQNEPFGLAVNGDFLYIGNTDAVVRVPYKPGQTAIKSSPQQIAKLPSGGHSTRNVIFNKNGTRLYVSVGSRSNVSDESDTPMRAAISEMNPDGSGARIYASGIRNPVGLAWNPATGDLWTAVNERDGLGDDLVPDYATAVQSGAFYGWPYSYIGSNPDPRRKGEHPQLVARAVVPSVLIQAHSAALGITFYNGTMFPQPYRGGAFVALHGSWNRSRRTGYKVIHIPFRDGKPTGGYDDFITGWSTDPTAGWVWGRPVGVLALKDGSLLVADDGEDLIWRVTYSR